MGMTKFHTCIVWNFWKKILDTINMNSKLPIVNIYSSWSITWACMKLPITTSYLEGNTCVGKLRHLLSPRVVWCGNLGSICRRRIWHLSDIKRQILLVKECRAPAILPQHTCQNCRCLDEATNNRNWWKEVAPSASSQNIISSLSLLQPHRLFSHHQHSHQAFCKAE